MRSSAAHCPQFQSCVFYETAQNLDFDANWRVQVCVSYIQQHRAHKPLLPHWLIHFGLLGVFVVSTIDASVIPLPLPGSTDLLVLILAANGGNPWLLAIAAIAGTMIGGYLTWKTGQRGGEAMLRRYVPQRFIDPITRWVRRNGIFTVGITCLLPPPVPLMPFVLSAGALGMPRNRFLASFGVARTLRYSLIAWLGVAYGKPMIRSWRHYLAGWSDVILWSFVGLLTAAVLFGVWRHHHDQRRHGETDTAEARAA
jgi:membrane protein YqaA with SNARE-associated domain